MAFGGPARLHRRRIPTAALQTVVPDRGPFRAQLAPPAPAAHHLPGLPPLGHLVVLRNAARAISRRRGPGGTGARPLLRRPPGRRAPLKGPARRPPQNGKSVRCAAMPSRRQRWHSQPRTAQGPVVWSGCRCNCWECAQSVHRSLSPQGVLRSSAQRARSRRTMSASWTASSARASFRKTHSAPPDVLALPEP